MFKQILSCFIQTIPNIFSHKPKLCPFLNPTLALKRVKMINPSKNSSQQNHGKEFHTWGFPEMEVYPKNDSLEWKIPLNDMD